MPVKSGHLQRGAMLMSLARETRQRACASCIHAILGDIASQRRQPQFKITCIDREDILQSQHPIYQSHSEAIRPLLDRRVNREQRRWPQESQSDTAAQNSGTGRPGVGDLSATPRSDASFSIVEVEKHQFDAEVIEGVLQSRLHHETYPNTAIHKTAKLSSLLQSRKCLEVHPKSSEGLGQHFLVAIDWQIS
ncbi:uncharacterized protein K444DRAFT_306619 [Hyaloscypha bicolor E]|uniref:Uncharacterized protein n=1 Tax=Hyaloscypha bicolor E TaxID=1095630 RepID=A0A2J6TMI0_9HELO|nr:uncharacterized protein K444DRAFT_306619 [Hyaloscypha bicolor E]PMD64192.1 hypothetical protein K444DRAFT_306619 [Hyaloscypha bicolor E]